MLPVELLCLSVGGDSATTELKWEGRVVSVNNEEAFKQLPGEPKGSFQNSFAHLILP